MTAEDEEKGADRDRPWLSVVVAVRDAEGSAGDCLGAVLGQCDAGVEVVVVTDSEALARSAPPPVRTFVVEGLVNEMWAEGIRQARGDLVGLLASTVVPAPDWVSLTGELHAGGDDVVGGAIEPAGRLRAIDWAVYFCRYSPYLRPLDPSAALEVPGDNASYRADVLREYAHLYRTAFWEPSVHHAMRADGRRLRMSDERVVHHAGGQHAAAFCRQRFVHGREHGAAWARGRPRTAVLARAAAAPLVPAVMIARAARSVFAKRRHRARFLLSVPLLLVFFGCWAAGELVGRLRPGGQAGARASRWSWPTLRGTAPRRPAACTRCAGS